MLLGLKMIGGKLIDLHAKITQKAGACCPGLCVTSYAEFYLSTASPAFIDW